MVISHRCRKRAIAGCLRTVVGFMIPMEGRRARRSLIILRDLFNKAFVLFLAIGGGSYCTSI
jgi:hypothetical protein